jgi:hypothetical protein
MTVPVEVYIKITYLCMNSCNSNPRKFGTYRTWSCGKAFGLCRNAGLPEDAVTRISKAYPLHLNPFSTTWGWCDQSCVRTPYYKYTQSYRPLYTAPRAERWTPSDGQWCLVTAQTARETVTHLISSCYSLVLLGDLLKFSRIFYYILYMSGFEEIALSLLKLQECSRISMVLH